MAADIAELNQRFASLAAQDPRIRYVPAEQILAGPAGAFADVLPGPAGPERVRWADGLHVCPDGSVRIARPVLRWITGRWNAPVAAGWPSAGWRTSMYAGGPDCPAP
jgi:hypothetical protein